MQCHSHEHDSTPTFAHGPNKNHGAFRAPPYFQKCRFPTMALCIILTCHNSLTPHPPTHPSTPKAHPLSGAKIVPIPKTWSSTPYSWPTQWGHTDGPAGSRNPVHSRVMLKSSRQLPGGVGRWPFWCGACRALGWSCTGPSTVGGPAHGHWVVGLDPISLPCHQATPLTLVLAPSNTP